VCRTSYRSGGYAEIVIANGAVREARLSYFGRLSLGGHDLLTGMAAVF